MFSQMGNPVNYWYFIVSVHFCDKLNVLVKRKLNTVLTRTLYILL